MTANVETIDRMLRAALGPVASMKLIFARLSDIIFGVGFAIFDIGRGIAGSYERRLLIPAQPNEKAA